MSDLVRRAIVGASVGLLVSLACASAQAESIRSQCSDRYNAAQKANTLGGMSWSKFYKQCKAELKGKKVAPTPATAPAAPPPAAAPSPKAAAPAAAPAVAGPIVFPKAISSQYANLSAGKARFKTCDDQYKANKATNSNGGLKWIQKGGGYYSLCNKHLKGE